MATVQNNIADGDALEATPVMNNFNEIYTNITNSNVAAAAAISSSKLDLTSIASNISFDSTKGVVFENSAGVNDCSIIESASDSLVANINTAGKKFAVTDSGDADRFVVDLATSACAASGYNYQVDNAKGYYAKDSGGTARQILSMDTNDVIEFGRMAREGGSATNWHVSGSTDYTTDDFTIQAGIVQLTSSVSIASVVFPKAFSNVPLVFFNPTKASGAGGNVHYSYQATVVSAFANSCTFNYPGSTVDYCMQWLAIGPI